MANTLTSFGHRARRYRRVKLTNTEANTEGIFQKDIDGFEKRVDFHLELDESRSYIMEIRIKLIF